MTPFYKEGVLQALEALGLKCASRADELGTPFPSKSKNIPAERLADMLQQQNDEEVKIYPENGHFFSKGKHVSWGAPISMAGLDEGQPVGPGIMVPFSPRG